MTLTTIPLLLWWLAIIWTYSEILPRPFDDWKNALLYGGAGIFVIAQLVRCRSEANARRISDDKLIAAYFICAALSLIAAPSGRYEGVLELARLTLWLGLAWALGQCTENKWRWLLRVTVLSAALISTLTWLQLRGADIWPYSGNFAAPIGHITYYGDFMAISLIMAMFLLWQAHSRSARVLWGITIIAIDMGLALAATRASVVGIVAGSIISLLLLWRGMRSSKLVLGAMALIVFNIAIILNPPVTTLRGESVGARLTTSITQANVNAEARWHTYITSAHMGLQRPLLGWGLGSFRFNYPEFAHANARDELITSQTWYMHPHNELLHQWVELGVPGTLLFMAFWLLIYVRGWRHLQLAQHELGPWIILSLSGLTVALVSWQFSTNFLFPVSRLVVALFGGILWNVCSSRSFTAFRMTTTFRMTGIVFVSAVTLFLLAYDYSLYAVQRQQRSGSFTEQQQWAATAVRWAPGAFDTEFVQAVTQLHGPNRDAAVTAMEKLHGDYPYVPAVLHLMGITRLQLGDPAGARTFLEHSLRNDPSNAHAQELLNQLPH